MPSRLTTRYAVTAAVAILALAGCGGSSTPTTTASTTPSATKPVGGPPSSTPQASTPAPSATCAQATYAELSDEQRVGQLLMVGFDTNATLDSLDDEIGSQHIGNVIYLGGWDGAEKVRSTSAHLQKLTSTQATGGIGLIIAADQEGGEVHQLRGVGFTRPPSASQQAQLTPDELTTQATLWARELKDAGVNVNLAPVTDTVPAQIGRANEPIGKWGRQYGSTPRTVSRAATAFLKGMLAGGIEGTVKHFPGLGRIRGNTDFTTTGITDDVATVDDPFLAPFQDGIDAGAGLVMVSSARYPKLDAKNAAMFSPAIIDALLRGRMGYTGVVITDDLNAAAARTLTPADRAVRYVSAGGDILLTGDPSVATTMMSALATSAANSPALATKVKDSVMRVLTLKERMGLLPCSAQTQ